MLTFVRRLNLSGVEWFYLCGTFACLVGIVVIAMLASRR